MSNTWLTPTWFTRKCLAVLHAKLNFIGTVNRQYDDAYEVNGAKIGDSLKIRLPNKYTVRTGRVAQVQGSTDQSVTMTIATQKGVDVDMFSSDLALNISQEDYVERVIEPAMAVLASSVEADALNMVLDVWNFAGTAGAVPDDLDDYLSAGAIMNRSLAPRDGRRYAMIDSATSAGLVYNLRSLFQDSASISKQYLEGVMGKTAGFTFLQNDLLPNHVMGTASSLGSIQVSGSNQTGSSLLFSGTTSDVLSKGTVFTLPNVYQVHPETKQSYGVLQRFVVTADATFAGSAATVSIEPPIYTSTSGGLQTVDASPVSGVSPTFLSGTSATTHVQNICYHSDAFAVVTAALPLPKNIEIAVRQTMDGLSIRYLRGYDVINDAFISRLDILYGYQTLRRELACRVTK